MLIVMCVGPLDYACKVPGDDMFYEVFWRAFSSQYPLKRAVVSPTDILLSADKSRVTMLVGGATHIAQMPSHWDAYVREGRIFMFSLTFFKSKAPK